ncbi:MAG: parvulin peptidyl-prolyl isomerase [Porticoccaceae bacterium]|nr:MAG: parvulin peptidyl-prolyl isomerase [Porticoccaceae bacterium]
MNCPSDNESPERTPIDISEIKVNGAIITPDEVAREMQYHSADSQEAAINKSSEVLIIQLLLLQKAKEEGLDKNLPEESDIPSEETMISRLIEKEASAQEVTEEECQRYFDANKNQFVSQDLLQLKHILLGADPEDKDKRAVAKEAAESLISRLVGSFDEFEALVNEHSDCPSKETGGSLGQITRGQTTSEFEEAVFELDEGLAKDPVESRYGFHVVYVDKKLPGKQLDYDKVKSDVANMLMELGQRKAIAVYIHKLVDEADIEGIDFEIGRPLTN